MTDGGACSSPLRMLASVDACPVASCRYNIAEDDEGHRCALLYADRGGMSFEEVGLIFHLSRQRMKQIEAIALAQQPLAVWAKAMGPNAFEHASGGPDEGDAD